MRDPQLDRKTLCHLPLVRSAKTQAMGGLFCLTSLKLTCPGQLQRLLESVVGIHAHVRDDANARPILAGDRID